jgi:hypothetical protein
MKYKISPLLQKVIIALVLALVLQYIFPLIPALTVASELVQGLILAALAAAAADVRGYFDFKKFLDDENKEDNLINEDQSE